VSIPSTIPVPIDLDAPIPVTSVPSLTPPETVPVVVSNAVDSSVDAGPQRAELPTEAHAKLFARLIRKYARLRGDIFVKGARVHGSAVHFDVQTVKPADNATE
jgi:hypothetical protein